MSCDLQCVCVCVHTVGGCVCRDSGGRLSVSPGQRSDLCVCVCVCVCVCASVNAAV